MATAIMNMSSFPLQYPSQGRLQIRMITRAVIPGSVPSTLGDNCYEFHFNPLFHLSSPGSAFAFFLGNLATMDSRVGTEIIYPIATFAFDQVRSRNWAYGLSLSVILETVYVLDEPRSQVARADLLDGQMVLNDTSVRDYYDFLLDSEDDTNTVGMSDQEICMLKTQRLSDDEEGESCCICLEVFMRGMVITQLAPCSHRFHNGCIAQWLQKNRTCPICRRRCIVSVFHKCRK